jgi:hypothetical protein
MAEEKIELTGERGTFYVTIDTSDEIKPCSGCGAGIQWATTRKGKKMPVHMVGGKWVCHFDDCPQADRFRKG